MKYNHKNFLPIVIFLTVITILFTAMKSPPRANSLKLVGKKIDISSLSSIKKDNIFIPQKAIMLHAFSTTCKWCRYDLATFKAISDKVPIYGLLYKERPDQIDLTDSIFKVYRDILRDKSNKLAIKLGINGLPTTFIIGNDGTVLYTHLGPLTEKEIRNDVLPLFN